MWRLLPGASFRIVPHRQPAPIQNIGQNARRTNNDGPLVHTRAFPAAGHYDSISARVLSSIVVKVPDRFRGVICMPDTALRRLECVTPNVEEQRVRLQARRGFTMHVRGFRCRWRRSANGPWNRTAAHRAAQSDQRLVRCFVTAALSSAVPTAIPLVPPEALPALGQSPLPPCGRLWPWFAPTASRESSPCIRAGSLDLSGCVKHQ